MRLRIVKLLLFGLAAAAQQPSVKFTANSNLVVLDVTVRDKSGNLVEGLEKEDFAVLEDGKAQAIQVFEFQKLTQEKLAVLPPPPPPPKDEPISRKVETINVPAAGQIQYHDKRLLCLFFDLSGMGVPEQVRAQQEALKFIDEKMTASDMVSIMTFSGGVRVENDFTPDREALRKTINNLPIGELADLADMADDADEDSGEDTGQAFIADETEFNVFNTDRKLAALESAVKKLALLPEKKALVYFSAGVGKTGVENQSQLLATVNAAVRSNVAFYPVDARGLAALPPGGDASKAASRGTGMFSGSSVRKDRDKFNSQQETLTSLAADTGGKAFLDSNDLAVGIVQAQTDVQSYYIVGYYSSNYAEDGRFRKFTVKLAAQPQAKLEYRPGYYGPKQYNRFNASDKERQLTDALSMGDPFTDLRLALEVDYFRITPTQYFVPVSLKIPGSDVTMAKKKGSSETDEFDFAGQILDSQRKLAGSVRDLIRVKLTDDDAAKLAKSSFHYDCGFVLAPGKYRIKMVVRENGTGKIGTFDTRFEVPDLSTEGAMRMSSVVWAGQREPLNAAVGAAEKQKKLTAANPLVQGGQKLVPSVTKVFRKSQSLYVYSEIYEPGAEPSIAASLSIFRGHVKEFESNPVRLTQAGPHPGTLPIEFQVPLAKLKPGKYTAQLNVIDEAGGKFAFRRSPLVLVP